MNIQLILLPIGDESPITVAGSRFCIGRASDNDLRLDDCRVSRHHCELILEGGEVLARDLQSSNGTFVNYRRIYDAHPLENGDFLILSNVVLRIAMSATETQDDGSLACRLPIVVSQLPCSPSIGSGMKF